MGYNLGMSDQEYMTAKQVQRYLQISDTTLLKWRAKGLPFIKLEKKVLFKKSDVDAFMESYRIINLPKKSKKPKK